MSVASVEGEGDRPQIVKNIFYCANLSYNNRTDVGGTNGDRGVLSYRGLTDGLRRCQVRRL